MWRCLSSNLLWGGALEIFFDFNFPANSDQQNNHQWLHYILRAPKLNQAAIGLLMRLSESWRCTSQADSILNVWHGAPITWPPISIMLRLLKRWTKDRFIKPPLFNSGGWQPTTPHLNSILIATCWSWQHFWKNIVAHFCSAPLLAFSHCCRTKAWPNELQNELGQLNCRTEAFC